MIELKFEIIINHQLIIDYTLKIEYCADCGRNADGVGDATFSRFAIDDIKVRPGLCDHETDYVYNFENGIEDLQLENIQPRKSRVLNTYSPSLRMDNTFPAFDHTRYSEQGTYLLFRPSADLTLSKYYRNTIAIENLESDGGSHKCVRFAYQLTAGTILKAFSISDNDMDYDYENRNVSMLWYAKK